ncbi:uncharacterized protein LOC131957375 [Physella acuta]|uniref:uncharacterized protein LOC131957375 n=1 Tax=Physella acuta TaxID=109671 RepID=UPI0027DCAFD1|nr:uncharacterized protein LOC131957375 [Physella acuta]XP_059178115.1 uncharacterized protein LOC131957375 [Physella acuta]XP_059178116.1 uncharacterized protein LOC131957375 [Physella acuta]XP_059178117.1 uncharacterized protein LOC131957375 [Physella acuta]XP_059178118.1 uncharacterized protein LOC131957375 [Physella acuta]
MEDSGIIMRTDVMRTEAPHVTSSVSYVTLQADLEARPFVLRLEFCRKFSPPPIPPWLVERPERLRHLVANCSSWRRYTDLCSLEIAPEYPQALAERPRAAPVIIQWIPLIVALFIATFIIVAVTILYRLYKSNRMKCGFCTDYKNYSTPTRSMVSSVTIETQLSICALEDESLLALRPSHLIYEDQTQSRGHNQIKLSASPPAVQRSPLYSREVILHPARLADAEVQSRMYITDLSVCDYYSSHSLPTDADALGPKVHQSSILKLENNENRDSRLPEIVSLPAGSDQLTPLSECSRPLFAENKQMGVFQRSRRKVRGMVQSCRKAGATFVQDVFGHRPADVDRPVPSAAVSKRFSSLSAISRSFRHVRLPKHRLFRRSQSLEYDMPRDMHVTSFPGKYDETTDSVLPVTAQEEVTANSSLDFQNPHGEESSNDSPVDVNRAPQTMDSRQKFSSRLSLSGRHTKLQGLNLNKMPYALKKFAKNTS